MTLGNSMMSMLLMKKLLFPALLGTLFIGESAVAKGNIAQAMTEVYGAYNPAHKCWVLKDDYSYCMKVTSVHSAKDADGNETVFLLALGDAIEDEGHIHAFSTGGRLGMIVYESQAPDTVKVIATHKNEPVGMDGCAPPAENFMFTQIGPAHWAWRFNDYEGRQGQYWRNTTFYAPCQGAVRPLFSLQTETSLFLYDMPEEKTTMKRTVTVKTDKADASGYYPIEVEVTKAPEEKVKPGKYVFRFSAEKDKYMPEPGSSMAIELVNQGEN